MSWLSVKEAAESLGLNRSAVYALVAKKQLACYRIGPNQGRIRFKASDLEAYVESCREGPKVKSTPRQKPPPLKYSHDW